MSRQLRHDVPLPAGLETLPTDTAEGEIVEVLRRWLSVLDLAITPPMVRDELANAGVEKAAAVLKYYVQKKDHVVSDRDKTDFVVTWLYRHAGAPGAWSAPGSFEKRVSEIIGEPVPLLPEEHKQLVREFHFIREEVEDVRHFDALVDSSMVQRVRDIKAAFGDSFYHPTVLATVASYNVDFGKKFDELFKEATRQIKAFAQNVQQQGGSVLTRLEGDVTVKQLEDMEDQQILHTDYREAQEQFRKVSKFKKVVDSKRKGGTASVPPPVHLRTADEAKPLTRSATVHGEFVIDDTHATAVPVDSVMALQLEEGKLRNVNDSIRNFVKAADPARAQVVPMRHGNIVLATHELEAFRVDYLQEKSFRADFANLLLQIVACGARIDAELVDFKSKQSSAYLWKPHADSLTNLVRTAQAIGANAQKLMATALQRGLGEKANGMNQSLTRLMEKVQTATGTLSELGSGR